MMFTNPPAPMVAAAGAAAKGGGGKDFDDDPDQNRQQNSNSKDDSKKSNNDTINTNNAGGKGFHHSDARNMDERPIPTIGAAHLQQLEQERATTTGGGRGTHTTTAFLSVHDLVHFAITSSSTRSATLREIYDACEKHGRIAHKHNRKSRVITSNGHWKSQVRHALYTSKRFTRNDAKGVQGDRWRVIPQFANEPVHTVVVDDAGDSETNGIATATIAINHNGTTGSNGGLHNSNKAKASVGASKKPPKTTGTGVTTNKRTTRKNPTKAQLAAAARKNMAENNKSISSDLLHDAHATGFQNGQGKSNGTQDIFSPSTAAKRSLGQIMDEDLSSFDMEAVGRKFMRFTPDPSLNDQTANMGGAIGGEVKHQHPYDQNPKVNGHMVRPLSPVAKRSIPISGPNELRHLKAKPRDLLRNRRKSSSASVGQAPCSPDAIDKLNEYFPKESDMATMFSFF